MLSYSIGSMYVFTYIYRKNQPKASKTHHTWILWVWNKWPTRSKRFAIVTGVVYVCLESRILCHLTCGIYNLDRWVTDFHWRDRETWWFCWTGCWYKVTFLRDYGLSGWTMTIFIPKKKTTNSQRHPKRSPQRKSTSNFQQSFSFRG